MTTSAEGLQQSGGVEMRVHGVGDHGLFSALGKPVFTGTVADRVRIGSLPLIPKHELKLINWSRPSRRITRTLGWYLAYPFTLVNMAGFMGPERSEDRAERRLWSFMRTAIVVSSLMMTFAMAMWMTVILETAWRLLGGAPSGLGSGFLCVFAPALLAGVVVNRMLRGRPLVDQGNRRVALLTLAVLLCAAGFLAARAVTGKGVLDTGEASLRDPMTVMVGITTLVAWSFASAMCCIAWRAESSRKGHGRASFRPVPDRTALAGAGILIAFAIAILHTAGAGLRLSLQTILKYTPPVIERRVLGGQDSSRMVTETATYAHFDHVLPIDMVPVLFLVMAAVFSTLVWREYRRRKPMCAVGVARPHGLKEPAPSHVLLRDTHEFLGRAALVGMLASLGLWTAVAGLTIAASNSRWGSDGLLTPLFIALKIAGLLLLVVVVVRRPEHTIERVKLALESVTDVAGFWAPDLHPLAGASYRLAVLRGLRRGVQEVRKDEPAKPIALVGHSQGAVICAWFIRGGHWQENSSENYSDEHALTMRLHDASDEQSHRIALFTCGSPIGSLYRTFFPRYFNENFCTTAARKSYGNVWHNYWRSTDPIGARLNRGVVGTAVDEPQVHDIDVTELEDEMTMGHYEYWQDGRVRRDIEEYFASFDLAGRSRLPATEGGVRQRSLRSLKAAFPRLHLHGN
jgi:hypothetical protein